MAIATRRRLRDELNIETSLQFVYKFAYEAEFGDAGSENELCHVYLGRVGDDFTPNANEIAAVRFVRPDELVKELAASPATFTPWLRMEWQALSADYRQQLGKYCRS